MSIKYMACVWEKSKQTGTNLLLLLALADHANDAGVCWPGIPHLARKIRRSERQTKRLIRQLIADGELEVAEGVGRGHTNLYKILLDPYENGDADDTITDEKKVTSGAKKVTPTTKKVTPVTEKGDIAMSPESSITVKEPSGNLSPANAENPSEPDSLPPTDNPNSITNRPVEPSDENQGSSASTGDYDSDVLRHANNGESWTVAGSDGFSGDPVDAYCELINISLAADDPKRETWGRELQRVAGLWEGVGPQHMAWALRAWRLANVAYEQGGILGIESADSLGWRKPSGGLLFQYKNDDNSGFSAIIAPLLQCAVNNGCLALEIQAKQKHGRKRGAMRGSQWTEQELWEAARESLAMCPDHVLLGCATEAEFWKLTPAEFEERIQGANERAETWQAATTGDVARAIAEVGGVKIDLEWTRTRWEMREREA